MRLKKYTIILLLLVFCKSAISQVKTNFNNSKLIKEEGFFEKGYTSNIDFVLPSKNIAELMQKEKVESEASSETKPFNLADPTTVDINIVKLANWKQEGDFSFCRYTIQSSGSLSNSINFDDFYLPQFSEMYIYNKNGAMITGPISENENNKNKIWGSWVYQGEIVTIEIKTPTKTFNKLKLHIANIAYGYKEVYKSVKVGGFGESSSCNINVICPLGNGWEPERNSVSLILSDNGKSWCSGALIMNTCNTNRPFYLTANHCFNPPGLPQQNVGAWRFTFQAFSSTCTPNQNSDGVITYNGSTLRANWTSTDFCLVELNNTPSNNLGIYYAGWSKSNIAAQNATGIHHPQGDVMKISRTNNPLTIASVFGGTNQHWQVNWNQGVTEPGSSGSPLFDPNHRIVGQLEGGLSKCGDASLIDFYGRFDLSWSGGGTNATRLSNWLDPNNSGALTTNTTNVANLFSTNPTINGDDAICSGSKTYTLFGAPVGTSVSWSISNSSIATLTGGGNQITLTKNGNGFLTLKAVFPATCGNITVTKLINVGIPQTNYKLSTAQTLTTLCGWDVTLSNLCNATGFVWQDFTSLPYWQGTGSSQYLVKENVDYGPITLNYTIAAVNQCGTGNFVTKSVNVPAPWRTGNCRTPAKIAPPTISSIPNIQVAPNPATNSITATKNDNVGFNEIRIFDKLGTLRKQIKYPKNIKSATINLNGLGIDIYRLQAFDGVNWSTISFSKL